MRLGATPVGEQETQFVVWAPKCNAVSIRIISPEQRCIPLTRGEHNYFTGAAPVRAGARYFVVLNQNEGRPDPASRYQPEGVHGPSEVVNPDFNWSDGDWRGIELQDYIIYELHVGTFSEQGTFDSAIAHLDELKELGVTAVEIMPVAQFPGVRNWGYDGVQPFAVQNSYGGPAALKRLVDACHARGLAVILDVVYNHMGPEGNYLGEFGPYFTGKYKTPWGPSVNVDGPHSDEVRRFLIDNVLEWITDYHFDALRLDAVHGILDTSAKPFLAELSEAVHERAQQLGRHIYLIAESDLNDVRVISPVEHGGMGMHSQWTDDFHHSLHALLTGENDGYYTDFGSVANLATSLRRAFVFTGQFSRYRVRRHGNDPAGASDQQFVVCMQNHDQVGNRMTGDRISALVDLERQKLGAAVVLLSPFVPLLWMGEEYAEQQPFPYFIDHSDGQLAEAVRNGRREEFASFTWQGEPPDPHARATFDGAKLRRSTGNTRMRNYYRRLIELRKAHKLAAGALTRRNVAAYESAEAIAVFGTDVIMIFSFAEHARALTVPIPAGRWRKILSSREPEWGGSGDSVGDEYTGADVASLTLPGVGAFVFARVS